MYIGGNSHLGGAASRGFLVTTGFYFVYERNKFVFDKSFPHLKTNHLDKSDLLQCDRFRKLKNHVEKET